MEKLSLKEQLASVEPLLENLREIREKRLRQFAEVLSQIEKIKAEIEGFSYPHPPTNDVKIEQDDLSVRRLTEYQLQLKSLQKDKVCFLLMQFPVSLPGLLQSAYIKYLLGVSSLDLKVENTFCETLIIRYYIYWLYL